MDDKEWNVVTDVYGYKDTVAKTYVSEQADLVDEGDEYYEIKHTISPSGQV